MILEDSVVLITGASAGIGAAITRQVAQAGGQLVLTGRRQSKLEGLVSSCGLAEHHVLILAGDIREQTFCQQLIDATVEKYGRVDVVINNAGLGHFGLLKDLHPDDFRQIWETNVYGLAWLSQAAAKQMLIQTTEAHTQRRGQIINVSSIVEDRPLVNQGAYTASKAAVNGYSRALRMELAEDDITVSILYPGLTATEFHTARLGSSPKNPNRSSGIPAEKVAEQVVKAIQWQKQEIYVTWYDWFFVQANRHFPALTDYVFRHVANGK
ncbi:MAG: SDR family NAD(P)-dependent oxidoreductase [Chloroflexota bacterium]